MCSLLYILLLSTLAFVCIATPSNKTQAASSSLPFASNACGGISPLTRWARTGRSNTIQMNVNTSSCRFESTPMYFTSITGIAGQYLLVGVNAIYEPTQSDFVINVRTVDNHSADALMAWSAEYRWNVNWFGFLP